MEYEKIYQKLKDDYTDEEIVDAVLIPQDLTAEEHQELSEEMKQLRLQKLQNTTAEEFILSNVMRLRFQIEHYLREGAFSFDKTFGKYLEAYRKIVKKSRKEISEDLSISYTTLNRIMDDEEEPNIELSYRLEHHSGGLIKTELWWKLMIKKHEFIIAQDKDARIQEQKKVKNALRA